MDAMIDEFRTYKHASFSVSNDSQHFMKPTKSSLLKQKSPHKNQKTRDPKSNQLSVPMTIIETKQSLNKKEQDINQIIEETTTVIATNTNTNTNTDVNINSTDEQTQPIQTISLPSLSRSKSDGNFPPEIEVRSLRCLSDAAICKIEPQEIFHSYFSELDDVFHTYRQSHQNENESDSSLINSAKEVVGMLNEQRNHHRKLERLSEDSTLENDAELAVRMIEVQCGLRKNIIDLESFMETKKCIQDSLDYLQRLENYSKKLNVLKGALFQECLGRGSGLQRKSPCLNSYPTGIVRLEDVIVDQKDEAIFIRQTIDLCDLVRIKLADDNDLKTGTAVLVDALGFFEQISVLAGKKNATEWSICEELIELSS